MMTSTGHDNGDKHHHYKQARIEIKLMDAVEILKRFGKILRINVRVLFYSFSLKSKIRFPFECLSL